MTNVEGKHDVKKTNQSIKSSQSRRGMRQSMDDLFSKINKVEPQLVGPVVTPKSVNEAFELLRERTKDPSCLASIIGGKIPGSVNAQMKRYCKLLPEKNTCNTVRQSHSKTAIQ